MFFIVRRHLAEVEGAEDVVPGFGGGGIVEEVGGEGIEAEVAFLFLGAMAAEAATLEDGADILIEGGGAGGSRACAGESEDGEGAIYQ